MGWNCCGWVVREGMKLNPLSLFSAPKAHTKGFKSYVDQL